MSFLTSLKEKINANLADEELVQKRLTICNSCDFLLITRNCSKCGCFVDAKTKVIRGKCPIGKW